MNAFLSAVNLFLDSEGLPFKPMVYGVCRKPFFFVPNMCQPELGAMKEFRYRSAAFSAINEGFLFSINSINKLT